MIAADRDTANLAAPGPGRGDPAGPAPGDFPLALLLRHVGKLLSDQMRERLESLGIQPAQGQVLRLLGRQEGLCQRELTERMGIAAPTVSGIIRRMVEAGLVGRRGDHHDDRVVRVHLTERGRRLGRAAEEAVREIEQSLVAGLSVPQQRHAHTLLRMLRNNLGGRPPGPEPAVDDLLT